MPEFTLPAIPAVVTLLLNFFAPYAVALVVDPVWPAKYKKLVAIVVSLLLSALVLVFAVLVGGYVMPAWPVLAILAIAVAQASYDLVLKRSADRFAGAIGTGSSKPAE
jgi:hypothetical protein